MRKQFLFLFLAIFIANTFHAQTKATKIGYIDMEYILQNVTNYTEAKNQLEQKAEKWKQEIETKKIEINKLKDALKAEKALLTKELIDERENEIKFLENETLDYQQKRFGANGDLMLQKSSLAKPIQDQVFTAIQDIAERLKYDFIFDKSSDLTMLFAAKRLDISDQVLRVLNRSEKREQLTKKQLKEEEAKEKKEDEIDGNPALSDRQKVLEEKKAAREKLISDRIAAQEEKKKEFDEKRKQIQAERLAKKTGIAVPTSPATSTPTDKDSKAEAAKTTAEEAKQKQNDQKAKILEDRKKVIEDRKRELEEKRKQILAEREAKKNGTVSAPAKTEETKTVVNDTIKETAKTTAEDRKKIIEDRKKALEEKRKKILEEREANKKAAADKLKENTNKN